MPPATNCRESRAVPFFPRGEVWHAVGIGVIGSVDVDENLQFYPPLSAASQAQLAFQRQSPPRLPRVSSQPQLLRRPPLAAVSDTNTRVLAKEVRDLESRVEVLMKHVNTQDKIIEGFCSLRLKDKKPV